MPDIFERANQLAILSSGRSPQWVAHAHTPATVAATTGGAPSTAAAGVPLSDTASGTAVKTLVGLSPRKAAHRRQAVVTLTYDAATTYTVTVGGNAVATAANTDAATTLTDLADDLNASAPVAALVTATATDADGDGTIDSVTIVGDAEVDWSIDATVAGGAGTVTVVADPATLTVRVWLYGANDALTGHPGWQLANNGGLSSIDRRGYVERFDTAGIGRLFLEVHAITAVGGDGASVTYSPTLAVGPCLLETT